MQISALGKYISNFSCYIFKFQKCELVANSTASFRSFRSISIVSARNNDVFSWNTKITSCFKSGDINTARKVFDEMPQRNVVTWNCMISGFVKYGMISEARHMFDVMPTRNVVSWTAMLSGYTGCYMLEEARDLFDQIPIQMKKHACWDIMINGYIKAGKLAEARELFDQCCDRSVGLYNRMLSGYVRMGCVAEAYELFSSMPEHDLSSWTSMLTCYARAGLMIEARTMFDNIPFAKDVQAWTALIRGYMQNGMVDEGLKLFYAMPNHDVVAWNCMISGFVKNGRLKEALDLYETMPKKSSASSNSILYGFVLDGDMTNALNFFENLMPCKDTASWNTLISGFQTEEALFLFSRMIRDGFRPDETTYMTMASICGSLALCNRGKANHLQIIKTGYMHDLLICSSLISMYSKCGLVDYAATLFRSMEFRDIVTWNTMIVAQAYHGSIGKALELHSSMILSGYKPNHVTFLALLTACAHRGLVKEGEFFFKSMVSEWNITPRSEHYACMVDLFGRSGMLYEAYEFVQQLSSNVPSNAWETLLNYCKLHHNYELGEIVSQKISNMNPSNTEMSVLQSNICAAKGLWNESENIRRAMKEHDVKKEVGCSWVELGGFNL